MMKLRRLGKTWQQGVAQRAFKEKVKLARFGELGNAEWHQMSLREQFEVEHA